MLEVGEMDIVEAAKRHWTKSMGVYYKKKSMHV